MASPFQIIVRDASGRENRYPIHEELLVGSSPQNHIILHDPQVAAQHLIIHSDGSSVWFREDDGSGTLVNGRPTSEGYLNGDEIIQIGSYQLKVVAPEIDIPDELDLNMPEDDLDLEDAGAFLDQGFHASATSAPKRSRKSAGWTLFVASIYTLSIGVLSVGAVMYWQTFLTIPAAREQREDALFQGLSKYLQGKALLAKQQWKAAAHTLRQASLITPKNSPLQLVLKSYITRANNEWDALSRYQRGYAAFYQQKNNDLAITLLKDIPKDRYIYPKAQALYQKVFRITVAALLQEARKNLAAKRLAAAGQALARLNKYDPNNPTAKALSKTLEELEAATPEGRRRIAASIAKLQTGVNLFRTGQASRALAFFQKALQQARYSAVKRKAQMYINSIRSFKTIYAQGRAALRSGNYAKAISLLRRARSMDSLLGGGNRVSISRKLARAYYKQGRTAHKKKKYAQAFRLYRRSNSIYSNSAATNGMRQISRMARTFLNQGISLKGIDNGEARKLLRLVMLITPRSSPLYRKARKNLR